MSCIILWMNRNGSRPGAGNFLPRKCVNRGFDKKRRDLSRLARVDEDGMHWRSGKCENVEMWKCEN